MNADFLNSLTEQVLAAVFEVSNTLGAGFLEKVYERALVRELGLRGIRAITQASFPVSYKGHCVGEYFADIVVEDALVVELKCAERLPTSTPHSASIICARPAGRSASWSIFRSRESSGGVLSIDFSSPKLWVCISRAGGCFYIA